MGEEEKKDEDLNDAEEDAAEAEDQNEEDAGEAAEDNSPAPSRRSRNAAAAQSAKNVVPMWLWVASVVVLLGFAFALFLRNRSVLGSLNKTKNEEIQAKQSEIVTLQGKIEEQSDIIRQKVKENSVLKGEVGKLNSKCTSLQDNVTLTANENRRYLAETKTLKADLAKNGAALKTAQDDLAALSAAQKTASAEMKTLKTKLKAAEDMADGQKRVAAKEMTQRQNLQEEVAALNERVKFLKSKNEEYLGTIQELNGDGPKEDKEDD